MLRWAGSGGGLENPNRRQDRATRDKCASSALNRDAGREREARCARKKTAREAGRLSSLFLVTLFQRQPGRFVAIARRSILRIGGSAFDRLRFDQRM
jgi:hypothetical protein